MAAALRKWKRERGEDGNGPPEPSTKQQRESSPMAPSAESDRVTDEPVINHETGKKYVKEVRSTFKDDEESYHKFLELIEDVRRKQVDHAGLCNRVKELFRGHTSLILGFNMFLPKEPQITLPSTETSGDLFTSQQGMIFKRKLEAVGESKYKEFCEILVLHKKQRISIDYMHKVAEMLFADNNDILADFRTFLPTLGGFISEMPAQGPDQQPTFTPRKVKFVHLSTNVMESEAPGESSRRAELARKGKERMETTKSLEVARKLKETTRNPKEEARTKPTQACQPTRMSARNAARRQQVQTAPRNAVAAGSPHPTSDQKVYTRRAPPPPLPSTAENIVTKCPPDCKACEHVEYPIFNWQAEDPEYYAKGKANRERERQALIARGVPGSFSDP